MTRRQITRCEDIAEHYGRKSQEKQCISELSELLYVLTRRPDQRQIDWKNQLIDEIADVSIMMQQIMSLYAILPNEVDDRINFKLNRQIDRIKNNHD